MTRVFIDDHDVSECFNAVKLSADIRGGMAAELSALAVAVDVSGIEQLRMPADATRDLLIRHGWTPPAEPVVVPATTQIRTNGETVAYESVAPGLIDDNHVGPVSGRDLLDRFITRIQNEWEPGDNDTLTIERVTDDNDQPVPGKRRYTLQLTLNATEGGNL